MRIMANATIRNKTVSARVTDEISERAKSNLAKQGLTISEYIRLSLIKAANNDVRLVSFLDTPEAIKAKKESENGETKDIGNLDDFNTWIDNINEN
ncbi:hypothetical protein FD03_GL000729 [Companilactobacillus nodensis DSM 19682 = JCM 14932 = NBRC 107160]|uniref:RelB n=2 Tax=Companilactobacillus nodensis TaxID=460870 RepID=A0A0R1KKK3_9LACO|nr:hypothetical protein FD03_GL000729 [Companilactobacillus nodensis DSM 19682 = JCM 14932 = NBRC 107160]